MEQVKTFKLVIVGDSGVGKTAFIKRHVSSEFEWNHLPTLDTNVYPLKFATNRGELIFNVWDAANQGTSDSPRDDLYGGTQGAIVIFDVMSPTSYENVSKWYSDITCVCPEIPVVLCGNKMDIKDREVNAEDVIFPREHGVQYYDVSAKAKYNLVKPFLWLAQTLVSDNSLQFIW